MSFYPPPFTEEVPRRGGGGIMREAETKSRKQAKHLRAEMTKAEIILWTRLKGRSLHGHRFHRQHPIGPYIVDFACKAQMLIIEVDGATHSTDTQIKHDVQRTKFLETQAWEVLRISNLDIYENLNGVLEAIASKLPPPTASPPPPPQAGEETNHKTRRTPQ
jgi:very-short-patch-repair endonuclease